MLVLIGLCAFATAAFLLLALSRRGGSVLAARIDSFKEQAVITAEGEGDLMTPFSERIVKPTLAGLARAVTSVLPASVLANIENQLVMAGNPITMNGFLTLWLATASFFVVVVTGLVVLVFGKVGPQQALVVLVFGSFGLVLPVFWLKGRVKTRQKLVLKALPDALDLITTSVEAGLGLDAALARVAEKTRGPLAEELSRMLRDVAMGRLRREALADMGGRTGVEELIAFINAVIQAEQLGVGIAQVLRVQSEQLRMRRRQRAEQAAHEAPIKMIFPLVLFIFPAFMLIILGPAVITIGESLLK
ncbi:MAG: type II secretion system F family protein [Chloroflexi bacterium]|nr:type II secretion system F family protein [Chloroflexota bacterium]